MAGILEIKRGIIGPVTLNDGEFYLNKGISAVQIGSGSSILTLLPLNKIVTGDIILNGNIYANNLNISSSYALSSSYAYYAETTGNVLTASFASTASQAATASFVLSSNVFGPYGFDSILTASLALTASSAPGYLLINNTASMLAPYLLVNTTSSMLAPYVLNTQTSSFITNNQTGSFATTSSLSSYVLNSQTSSFITNNQTSSFLLNALTSSMLQSYVPNSQTGSFVLNSQTSSFVTNNQTSSFVLNSQTGSFILNSQTSSMTVGTASYVSSSNVYGPNGANSILTSSYALTASLAMAIVGGASAVSSSYPFNVTGSTIFSFNSNRVGANIYNVPTYQNILIGESAGVSSSMSSSVIIGYGAGYNVKNSDSNVVIGSSAAQYLQNVTESIFIGSSTGINARVYNSVFIGPSAGSNAFNAFNSNFIGHNTGRGAYSASYSTIIGYNAGYRVGTTNTGISENNIVIGTNVTLEAQRRNSINIGGIIFATGSYFDTGSVPFSGSAGGRIGINVTNPNYNLHVSGTISFSNLPQSSSAFIIMYDTSSGQLFYTASSAISGSGGGASLTGGTENYLPLWNSSTTLTTSSIYQTGSYIGINTTTPSTSLDINGSVQISNHLKLGTAPFPTWTTTTGSKFDAIDYIKDPTTNPQESMGRWTRSIYGSSSFTDFSNNRFEIVNFGRNLELAPGQTYNIASSNWNARKQAVGAGLGIGVSGSGVSPNTIYNSGYTLAGTNYSILGKVDFWPEFDAGTLPRNMNGQYSVFGGHYDIWAGSGSTAGNLNFYSAGGFKSMVSYSVDNVTNYYSSLEIESFESSRINNIYGFYSAPLYRSYATQSYGFYQSGSNDINYFEGRVGIGNGITNPSGSLHVSGNIYFSNLQTSSVFNVLLYDTASGQLFYTASSAIGGGTGNSFPYTGDAAISGSLTITGSLIVLGSASFYSVTTIYETASVIYSSGSNQFGDATTDIQTLIGTVIVSGSQQITGSLTVSNGITGSLFGTASNVQGGTPNYLALWAGSTQLSSSLIYQSGSVITISGSNVISGTLDITTVNYQSNVGKILGINNNNRVVYMSGADVVVFPYTGSAIITGSLIITGSQIITGSIGVTGSVYIGSRATENIRYGGTYLNPSNAIIIEGVSGGPNSARILLHENTTDNSAGSTISFARSRAFDNLDAGWNIGGLDFYRAWGKIGGLTAFEQSAYIRVISISGSTQTSVPSAIYFGTTPSGSITPRQRLVIQQNGNVGIGPLTASATLHVSGANMIFDIPSKVDGYVLQSDTNGNATWVNPGILNTSIQSYIATGSVTASVNIGTVSFLVVSGSNTLMNVSSSGDLTLSGSILSQYSGNQIVTGIKFTNGTSDWFRVKANSESGSIELGPNNPASNIILTMKAPANGDATIYKGGSNGGLNVETIDTLKLYGASTYAAGILPNTARISFLGNNSITEFARFNNNGDFILNSQTGSGHRLFISGSSTSGSLNVDSTFLISGSVITLNIPSKASGYVLQSDTNGNVTWVNPVTLTTANPRLMATGSVTASVNIGSPDIFTIVSGSSTLLSITGSTRHLSISGGIALHSGIPYASTFGGGADGVIQTFVVPSTYKTQMVFRPSGNIAGFATYWYSRLEQDGNRFKMLSQYPINCIGHVDNNGGTNVIGYKDGVSGNHGLVVTSLANTATSTNYGQLIVSASGIAATNPVFRIVSQSIDYFNINASGQTTISGSLLLSGSTNSLQFRLPTTTNGYILQSDANGYATWINPSTLSGSFISNYIATGSVTASVNIGTTSFQIVSGSSTFMTVTNNNRVGIGGVTSPSSVLHVSTSFRVTGGNGQGQMIVDTNDSVLIGPGTGISSPARLKIYGGTSQAGTIWFGHNETYAGEIGTNGAGRLIINPSIEVGFMIGGSEKARLNNSGSLAIGTSTNTGYRLVVSGSDTLGSFNADNILIISSSVITLNIPSKGNEKLLQSDANGYATWVDRNSLGLATTGSNSFNGNQTITGSLLVSGSGGINVTGSLGINGSLTENIITGSLGVGTTTIFQRDTGSFTAALGKYTINNSTNARAGEFMTVWNGNQIVSTDISTTDIGSTTDLVFTASVVSGQIRTSAIAASSGWNVKMLITYL